MNCFYHLEKSAVGLCKSCGRAVCPECAADTGQSLACKGRHEERTLLLDRMIDSNQKILDVSNKHLKQGTAFSVALGLVFLTVGVVALLLAGSAGWTYGIFLSVMGVIFFVRGLVGYTRSSRYPTLEQEETK